MKKLTWIFLTIPLVLWSQRDFTRMEVFHKRIQGSIYRLSIGQVVNVIAFDGPEGLLLIDAGYEQTAAQLRDTIHRLFRKEVSWLVIPICMPIIQEETWSLEKLPLSLLILL